MWCTIIIFVDRPKAHSAPIRSAPKSFSGPATSPAGVTICHSSKIFLSDRSIRRSHQYTAVNGLIYLGAGTLVFIWPGVVQTIFRDAAFVGNEAALIRVTGMTVMVIGWLYLFGGLSGGRRIVAASVLDRVVLVPLVLVPIAIAGVFPHFLLAFAFLDPTLGIGAWLLLSRSDRPGFHSAAGTP
jgi:hypothetical protein